MESLRDRILAKREVIEGLIGRCINNNSEIKGELPESKHGQCDERRGNWTGWVTWNDH
jgi:hypothetical protein